MPQPELPEQIIHFAQAHVVGHAVRRRVHKLAQVHVHVQLLVRELDVLQPHPLAGNRLGEIRDVVLEGHQRRNPIPRLLHKADFSLQHDQQVASEHNPEEGGLLDAVDVGDVEVDDREAVVLARLEDVEHEADFLDPREGDVLAALDIRGREMAEVFLCRGLQERDLLNVDVEVVDGEDSRQVGDRLGDQEHQHDQGQQAEVVGELKEDDTHGDCHSHRAGEEGGRPKQRVGPFLDLDVPRDARHQHADEAAVGGPAQDGGHKEPRRHGNAVGDHRQDEEETEEGHEGARRVLVRHLAREEVPDRIVLSVEENRREVVVLIGLRAGHAHKVAIMQAGGPGAAGNFGVASLAGESQRQAELERRRDGRDQHGLDDLDVLPAAVVVLVQVLDPELCELAVNKVEGGSQQAPENSKDRHREQLVEPVLALPVLVDVEDDEPASTEEPAVLFVLASVH
mmetsp:Transcript_6977/g.17143  ORF Transcript_6977/g.17143 Transcript_6977/m.17143 type:complete len:454 (-) Transcript_6977:431-1792(-)